MIRLKPGEKFSFKGLSLDEQWKALDEILNGMIAAELERLDASLKEDNDPTIGSPPDRGEQWQRVPKAEVMRQEAARLSTWKLGTVAEIQRTVREGSRREAQ